MNGKQLKNSILQWAIQGKLVPQDPNDEPASVLLERIREEKARLVKEKKIKKDKNESIIYRGEDNSYYEKFLATGEVKCIDEEIPFEIPSSWEWCRLGSIAEIIGGYAFPSHTLKGNQGTRVIRISDITENGFTNSRLVRYNGSPVSDIYRIQKFDILMAMTGGTVGKSLFVESMSEDMLLNQRVAIIRNRHICADYLNLVIKAPHIASVISDRKNSTNDNISMVDIYDFFIPVPPIENQKRIVTKYNELLPLVNKYGHADHLAECLNNGIKDKLRKSILQEAIQGRLVPQIAEEGTVQELLEQIKQEKAWLVKGGKLKKSALQDSVIFRGDDNKYWEKLGKEIHCIDDEIPFEIPASWQWVRIKDIFQINPKNVAEDNCISAFIPMEKICATYGSEFSYDEVQWKTIKTGYTHFADGDVVFAKITPCFQNRKSAIFIGLPNGIGAGTTELKVMRPYGETINRWYLLYFLKSPYFIDEAQFKGTANQQRIITGYLENKLFPLPTKFEQDRIVQQIKQLASIMSR